MPSLAADCLRSMFIGSTQKNLTSTESCKSSHDIASCTSMKCKISMAKQKLPQFLNARTDPTPRTSKGIVQQPQTELRVVAWNVSATAKGCSSRQNIWLIQERVCPSSDTSQNPSSTLQVALLFSWRLMNEGDLLIILIAS